MALILTVVGGERKGLVGVAAPAIFEDWAGAGW